MVRPITLQDVTFFSSASSCISHFEKAHWTKKTLSLIQSFGTLFSFSLYKVSQLLNRVEAQMAPYAEVPLDGFSKPKLVVCIHGLNSNPAQFKKIIDELKNHEISEMDIFVPYVLQKGKAKLDELVKPIFEEITKWANTQGEKELVLVGISNGGRVSRAIEAEIAKSDKAENIKKLKFISIVGACKGSSLANLAHRLHLSWLMHKNISKEMPTDSKRNARLHKDWLDGLSKTSERKYEYTHIAAPHDWQVPNYDSTLPSYESTLMQKPLARYAILPGHGHVSIVNATAKAVAHIVAA